MKSFLQVLFTFFISVLFCASLKAQAVNEGQFRMTKDEIIDSKAPGKKAPGSSNLSAVQVIVLFGDPSKAGLYTIVIKVAANTKIPAHLHPDQRIATVISGDWYFGYGNQFSVDSLKKLPAGSVYSEVAGQNHFAMTKDPVVVEITGYGPSGVTYVNPSDDPQNKK
jgi:quercetin dioxygenase-like cupin family protein